MSFAHLMSLCAGSLCRHVGCAEAVKQAPEGRWFITMGHAGFNSAANNRGGYATEKAARSASARYAAKRSEVSK